MEGTELILSYIISENLSQIVFISSDDNVNITIKSLPKVQESNWEITNCSIFIEDKSLMINELNSIYASIKGSNVTVNNGTYLMRVDLLDEDINVSISEKSKDD